MKNTILLIIPFLLSACISTGSGVAKFEYEIIGPNGEEPSINPDDVTTPTPEDPDTGTTDPEDPENPGLTTSLATIETFTNNYNQIILDVETNIGEINLNNYEEVVGEPAPLGVSDEEKTLNMAIAQIKTYTDLLLKTKAELEAEEDTNPNLLNDLKAALSLIGKQDIIDNYGSSLDTLIVAITDASNNISQTATDFNTNSQFKTSYLQNIDLFPNSLAYDLNYVVNDEGIITGFKYGEETISNQYIDSDKNLIITKNITEDTSDNKYRYTYNSKTYYGADIADLKYNMLKDGISDSVVNSIPMADVFINTNFYTLKSIGTSLNLTYSDFGVFMTQNGYLSTEADLSDINNYDNKYFYATGYENKIAKTPNENMTFTGKAVGTLDYDYRRYDKNPAGETINPYTASTKTMDMAGDVTLSVNASSGTITENFSIDFDNWYTITFTQTNGGNPSNTQYKNDSDYSGGDSFNLNGYSTTSNTIDKNYYGDTTNNPIEVVGNGEIRFYDTTTYPVDLINQRTIIENMKLLYWFGAKKN